MTSCIQGWVARAFWCGVSALITALSPVRKQHFVAECKGGWNALRTWAQLRMRGGQVPSILQAVRGYSGHICMDRPRKSEAACRRLSSDRGRLLFSLGSRRFAWHVSCIIIVMLSPEGRQNTSRREIAKANLSCPRHHWAALATFNCLGAGLL